MTDLLATRSEGACLTTRVAGAKLLRIGAAVKTRGAKRDSILNAASTGNMERVRVYEGERVRVSGREEGCCVGWGVYVKVWHGQRKRDSSSLSSLRSRKGRLGLCLKQSRSD